MNKKSLEALIKSGALDALGDRAAMLGNMEEALAYNHECAKGTTRQSSLFGLMEDASSVPKLKLRESPPVSKEQKLLWEKELLGLYISGHPLEEHREKLAKLDIDIRKIKLLREGFPTIVGGIIEEVKIILTSKGEQMAFIKIADFNDRIESVVFPRSFHEYKELLATDKKILAKGKTSHRNGTPSFIIEKVKELKA